MLNEATARKYAAAWANKVHANLQDLKLGEGGDFFGELGSLGFEYVARESTLVVRAYIFPNAASLTANTDMLPWLNRIAAENPDSVSHGVFEICRAPWEPDKEPSLFLRIDLKEGNLSDSDVISRLEKLREDAMIWRRNKLTKALGDMVRKQREGKQ